MRRVCIGEILLRTFALALVFFTVLAFASEITDQDVDIKQLGECRSVQGQYDSNMSIIGTIQALYFERVCNGLQNDFTAKYGFSPNCFTDLNGVNNCK